MKNTNRKWYFLFVRCTFVNDFCSRISLRYFCMFSSHTLRSSFPILIYSYTLLCQMHESHAILIFKKKIRIWLYYQPAGESLILVFLYLLLGFENSNLAVEYVEKMYYDGMLNGEIRLLIHYARLTESFSLVVCLNVWSLLAQLKQCT
jgi:hypothetical protein